MQFSKVFLLDYRFEEVQNLQFVVYDVDDKKRVDDVKRHDLIGHMECTMADIVTAGQQYTRNLRKAGTGWWERGREGGRESCPMVVVGCEEMFVFLHGTALLPEMKDKTQLSYQGPL